MKNNFINSDIMHLVQYISKQLTPIEIQANQNPMFQTDVGESKM